MFIFRRDGTYLDYHARNPPLLFVPPEALLGRKVVMCCHRARRNVEAALDQAGRSDDPVVVEYELPMRNEVLRGAHRADGR